MDKPLKRHASLIKYSKDHHYVLLLVWKIRQGIRNFIEPHRVKAYIDLYFTQEIGPHFEAEENYLLPLLKKSDSMRLKVEQQHQIIRKVLTGVRIDGTSYSEMSALAYLLEKHVRFEERVFLPYLENNSSFKSTSSSKIGPERMRVDIDQLWTDNFWEKKAGYT